MFFSLSYNDVLVVSLFFTFVSLLTMKMSFQLKWIFQLIVTVPFTVCYLVSTRVLPKQYIRSLLRHVLGSRRLRINGERNVSKYN